MPGDHILGRPRLETCLAKSGPRVGRDFMDGMEVIIFRWRWGLRVYSQVGRKNLGMDLRSKDPRLSAKTDQLPACNSTLLTLSITFGGSLNLSTVQVSQPLLEGLFPHSPPWSRAAGWARRRRAGVRRAPVQ